MPDWIEAAPGRLFVVATLLPLASFVVLLTAGTVRNLYRPARPAGVRPRKTGSYFATACLAISAALAVTGLVRFLSDVERRLPAEQMAARWSARTDWLRVGRADTINPPAWDRGDQARRIRAFEDDAPPPPRTALALEIGYKIDHLTAVLFAMVTVIGTGIFVYSLGYMTDETRASFEDHEVDRQTPAADGHHFRRRGRYGRFFLYLSLFCFAMLNLLVADNLFQVFVSWELVGVCSFFLIGFYYERPSAARAAGKAFVVNRVGDAGFLVGLLIAWTYLGTLNFDEMARRLRSPERDTHGPLALAHEFVRVRPTDGKETVPGAVLYEVVAPGAPGGTHVALFPLLWEEPTHFHGLSAGGGAHKSSHFVAGPGSDYFAYDVIPYWLFVAMGVGIFLGCAGKSAQIPLHTWLPDAMEGPTPVSALIHAATMVAAGVYLVGRCAALFAPEVLLLIAYTGAVTLFVSATVALVQTDIKRVLAYSTCSQLGYMMLALGVGGWVAGLLHLVTHAFFKALLFLCAGSVIRGCHHEQDLRKMGGLRTQMRTTALTMLVGVLAICGAPFFSGWYSKDMILSSALGYGVVHREHTLLFILPLVTVMLTAFYMFRLWFLAFAGRPREAHVYDHARESPLLMTLPLVVLAAFSVGVAWGSPPWDADASYLGNVLEKSWPRAVFAAFSEERGATHEYHTTAGALALLATALGAGLAAAMYWKPVISPAKVRVRAGPAYTFLLHKWYFDELYNAVIVRPTVRLASAAAAADKRPTVATPGLSESPHCRTDLGTLDGWFNAVGQAAGGVGQGLRRVQTGLLRSYVLALALTVAVLLGMLLAFAG